ncbi:hypothetical protein RJ639_022097 [Escallonia herrerae]|uniref:Uncharacterized protein n=1 Tax=Escallonia herrerae TaxID=1293975 RepID=A0AA89AGW7_9ASTE|nr:hypothetical protein RJ639_022097 [Escallonia herrerae]
MNKTTIIDIYNIFVNIFVAVVLWFRDNGEKPSSSTGVMEQKWNSFESLVQLDLTVEFRNGTDMIWQLHGREIDYLANINRADFLNVGFNLWPYGGEWPCAVRYYGGEAESGEPREREVSRTYRCAMND